MEEEEHIQCLMDINLKKVGCPILQAAFMGSREICMNVNTECWFLAPTPDMKMYKIPVRKIPEIIAQLNKFHRNELKNKNNGNDNSTGSLD